MGRIKYLSTTEWLKYLGQLELADFFLFTVSRSWYLPGVQLSLRSSVPLMSFFSAKRNITERSSIVCLSPDKVRGSSGCSRELS